MRYFFFLSLLFPFLCFATPHIVVTLKPIHSLISGVMQGVAEPELLLPDYASPHTFQLKPSTMKMLQKADLIVWVGPSLELFMVKPLKQLQPALGVLALTDIPDLALLTPRQGREWKAHDHDHNHDHDHGSAENEIDPHFWLSTHNAIRILEYIAAFLSEKDPSHQDQYQKNAKMMVAKINDLKQTLSHLLKEDHNQSFLVYHDAYQYFEQEFDLHGAGTMVINPHLPLSAKGLNEIRRLIQEKHVHCIFRETEFNDSLINSSLFSTNVKIDELDPLGARQPPGPNAYEKIMLEIGKTMHHCLSKDEYSHSR